jgi:hypothetical protein
VRVDPRVIVDEVPLQDVISRDSASVKVSAVIASERGSTIVFPFPIELVHALSALAPKGS